MSALSEQYSPEVQLLMDEVRELQEQWSGTSVLKAEDAGWKLLLGGKELDSEGPTLDELKQVSKQARDMTANPLIDRAIALRQSYIWSKPPQIPLPDKAPGTAGRKSALERFVSNPRNQASLLSTDAHEKMELAAITDGCFLLLADKSTKVVRPIPLTEIVDIMVHDDFSSEIQAYKRRWSHFDREEGRTEELEEWVYVENVPASERVDEIETLTRGQKVLVPTSKRYEMIDFWANQQVGWALGTPDALAAIPWARMYVELFNRGKVMTEELAKFIGRITNKTKTGHAQTGAKIAAAKGAGKFATMADGNQMEIFGSAGKTYDFGGIRPVAALVATAMEVSVVHLLSDPGAAGSSYGSASNLDLPTKRAVVQRQRSWASYLERVLKWATAQDVIVTFPTLDEPDPYREMQTVILAWQNGFLHADEARKRIAAIANVELVHDFAPEGILVPNNINSLARRDLDTDAHANATVASPGQGQANGTGGTSGAAAQDLRTDVISAEAMLRTAIQEMDRTELQMLLREVLN